MKKLILALVFLLLPALAQAADIRWVSTTGIGTGDCLTTGTACTRDRALTVTVAGDHIKLRDGTYTNWTDWTLNKGGTSESVRITVSAENRHMAILRPTAGSYAISIERSYITVRGLKVEGQKLNGGCIRASGTPVRTTIIMEDNYCFEIGTIPFYLGVGAGAGTLSNVKVRYNIAEEFGWQGVDVVGEGIYVGSNTTSNPLVSDVEGYGNTFRGGSTQVWDIKDTAKNFWAHHNLVEDWATGTGGQTTRDHTVGIVAVSNAFQAGEANSNVKIENSIFRAMLGWSHSSSELVFSRRAMRFNGNVIHDLGSASAITVTGSASQPQDFTGNTWCNTPTNNAGTAADVNFTSNLFNQAQSVCDAEVARITGEIAARPVIANAEIGLIAANKIRVTLINQSLAAIDGAAMVGNTTLIASVNHAVCTVSGMTPSRTITGSAVVGTNIIDFTLSGDGDSDDVPLLSCTAGAIVNTGVIGATWISDLASTATITNRAVTNNISGPAPTHVFIQSTYQFYSLRTENGLLVKRPHAASAVNTPVSMVKNGAINLAVQIDCDPTADCPPIGMMRKYSKNGGAYTQMPGEIGADGIALFGNALTASDIPSEGPTASTCLAGAFGAVPGAVVRSPNAVPTADMAASNCVVIQSLIRSGPGAVPGDFFDLEFHDQGAETIVYGVRPRITIIELTAGSGM